MWILTTKKDIRKPIFFDAVLNRLIGGLKASIKNQNRYSFLDVSESGSHGVMLGLKFRVWERASKVNLI